MRYLFILLLTATAFAGSSSDISVTEVSGGYEIAWTQKDTPVTLTRGDYDEGLMLFVQTEVYTGTGNTFTDTLGSFNTKFYKLSGSLETKQDINQNNFYSLVTDNLSAITHDDDSLVAEARFAQFGSVGILKWKSLTEGYKIVLDYSGTNKTVYNVSHQDGHNNVNYYIIDQLSMLSSVTVYKLHADMTTTYKFKLTFNFGEVVDSTTIINIVGGTNRNINIQNGDVFNGDVSNEDNAIFASGSGTNGGGGCFLSQ